MPYKIFVSYSTKNLPWVDKLCEGLSSKEVNVFVAEYSVNPGEVLTERIKKELTECDLFLLIWSSDAKQSEWVPQEIGIAEGMKKTILPIVLDESTPLPGFISNRKYLKASDDFGATITKLREIIQGQPRGGAGMSPLLGMAIGAGLMWLLTRPDDEEEEIEYYEEEIVEYNSNRRPLRMKRN